MNALIKHAAMVSTAALITVGTATWASAQTKTYGDVDMKQPKGEQSDFCASNPDKCRPDRVKESKMDWKFDSNRHERRRHKDATFRFYFGGYWYPQPYWEVYSIGGRVSCGEGRAIVAARFNRVRVVECRGRTYTYLGRRQGDTYRILLNSRTGRIVGRALI